MLRRLGACGLAFLLLAACGNGKIDSHKEGVEAANDVADDMVKVLNGVKDKASAESAKPKLEALGKKMEGIMDQMQKLGPPTDPKMQGEMMSMMAKVVAAMQKLPPEAQEALGSLDMGR